MSHFLSEISHRVNGNSVVSCTRQEDSCLQFPGDTLVWLFVQYTYCLNVAGNTNFNCKLKSGSHATSYRWLHFPADICIAGCTVCTSLKIIGNSDVSCKSKPAASLPCTADFSFQLSSGSPVIRCEYWPKKRQMFSLFPIQVMLLRTQWKVTHAKINASTTRSCWQSCRTCSKTTASNVWGRFIWASGCTAMTKWEWRTRKWCNLFRYTDSLIACKLSLDTYRKCSWFRVSHRHSGNTTMFKSVVRLYLLLVLNISSWYFCRKKLSGNW